MKAFAIVVKDNEISESGFNELKSSYDKFGYDEGLDVHYAVTLDKAKWYAMGNGLTWNYPWEGSEIDIKSGLVKTAYPTETPAKRMSCFLSHWYLWKKCSKLNETILILEHDARLIKKLPSVKTFLNCQFDIIGINDPSMATRKSKLYHDMILENENKFQPVPIIDEFNIPQGLAGNSAYVLKPQGANNLIAAAEEYGMWPNDALMCRQIIPNLGVTRSFYTVVQGLRSTTTL